MLVVFVTSTPLLEKKISHRKWYRFAIFIFGPKWVLFSYGSYSLCPTSVWHNQLAWIEKMHLHVRWNTKKNYPARNKSSKFSFERLIPWHRTSSLFWENCMASHVFFTISFRLSCSTIRMVKLFSVRSFLFLSSEALPNLLKPLDFTKDSPIEHQKGTWTMEYSKLKGQGGERERRVKETWLTWCNSSFYLRRRKILM